MADIENGDEVARYVDDPELHQVRFDFQNLQFGGSRAADMDGWIRVGNNVILMEFKCWIRSEHPEPAPIKRIHKEAFEFITDSLERAGVNAITLWATHEDARAMGNWYIDAAPLPVYQFYYAGSWRTPREPTTVREAIERFINPIAS